MEAKPDTSRINPAVKLENVYKTYNAGEVEVQALRGISLEIAEGEFVAILGASGSGKSTLMNILGCLDRPTKGRYFLAGQDVSRVDRNDLAYIRNEKIGFVFQGFNLLARTSALENVELTLLYSKHRLTTSQRRDKAMHALEILGLADRAQHHPSQLSGGQQQRVAIARALINDPQILLADEPTGNLDTQSSLGILSVFRELNKKGMTIIMITHEPAMAGYAGRNVMLRDGRIIADLSVERRLAASQELQSP